MHCANINNNWIAWPIPLSLESIVLKSSLPLVEWWTKRLIHHSLFNLPRFELPPSEDHNHINYTTCHQPLIEFPPLTFVDHSHSTWWTDGHLLIRNKLSCYTHYKVVFVFYDRIYKLFYFEWGGHPVWMRRGPSAALLHFTQSVSPPLTGLDASLDALSVSHSHHMCGCANDLLWEQKKIPHLRHCLP